MRMPDDNPTKAIFIPHIYLLLLGGWDKAYFSAGVDLVKCNFTKVRLD